MQSAEVVTLKSGQQNVCLLESKSVESNSILPQLFGDGKIFDTGDAGIHREMPQLSGVGRVSIQ
jgi:hypothetical protein